MLDATDTGQGAAVNNTIYLVDDSRVIRQIVAHLLKGSGATICPFTSAEQCLEELTMRDDSTPSCLLLDLDMPGMTGPELLRRLAEKHRQIPTVVITGHADSKLASEARANGVRYVLEKPFEAGQLLEAIEATVTAH